MIRLRPVLHTESLLRYSVYRWRLSRRWRYSKWQASVKGLRHLNPASRQDFPRLREIFLGTGWMQRRDKTACSQDWRWLFDQPLGREMYTDVASINMTSTLIQPLSGLRLDCADMRTQVNHNNQEAPPVNLAYALRLAIPIKPFIFLLFLADGT